jgi:hypothetical protein
LQDDKVKMASRSERFRQLKKLFVGAAREDVVEMVGLLESAGGCVPDGEAGDRFRKLAHDLRGTGGGYEFPAISDTAAEVEDAYLAHSTADALRDSLELLREAVDAARADLEPEEQASVAE